MVDFYRNFGKVESPKDFCRKQYFILILYRPEGNRLFFFPDFDFYIAADENLQQKVTGTLNLLTNKEFLIFRSDGFEVYRQPQIFIVHFY